MASPQRTSGSTPLTGSTTSTGPNERTDGTTRIADRGYRHFEGTRTGTNGAIRTTVRHTFARILGLRRGAKAKVLPFIVAGIAYLPAIVFVGIGLLFKRAADRAIPQVWEYYGFVLSAIVLFIAFSAPEALCPDRRHRVMGVYLSSPLTRMTYIAAKLLAVVGALCLVTLFPPLLMTLARSLQGVGPGPGELALTIVRIIVAGLMLSVFFALLALAAASLTDRKGFASAGIVLLTATASAVAGTLRQTTGSDSPLLLNMFAVPFELVRRVFGAAGNTPSLSTPLLVVVLVAWAGVFAGVVVLRYRRLEVTR